MPRVGAEVVDVLVTLHHVTVDALLVSLDGVRGRAVWLPWSQVEVDSEALVSAALDYELKSRPPSVTITIPTWLAEEKELV